MITVRYAVAMKVKGKWVRNGAVVECGNTYESSSNALYSSGHTDVQFLDCFSALKNGSLVFGHCEAGERYKLIPVGESLPLSVKGTIA